MKNVLILITNLKKGGAERVVSLISNNFDSNKNINYYLVLMERGIAYNLSKNIKPIILTKGNRNNYLKLFELPLIALKLKRIVKKNNIDTVLSFLNRPNYINILTSLFGGNHKKIINIRYTTSRYKSKGVLGKINLLLNKWLFNKADLIVSNSFGVDADLKSLFKITTKTQIINNPIDIDEINILKRKNELGKMNFNKNKKYLISVGRLIPLKRNIDLIDAYYLLIKKHPYLELIFLGEGILKESLIKHCTELNINKKVHFIGNVSNPFSYLNQSDIFILTSETEGFPNVLAEAIAVGIPVISSNCKSGPSEILENGKFGLLYPVGNINELKNGIENILTKNKEAEQRVILANEKVKQYKASIIIEKFTNLLYTVL
ncbi:MAG: glycosyltransferase [Flavobacteriaceae bacterium]|nr:glycosyltransferase [Flavobacteriaceae bacterium]